MSEKNLSDILAGVPDRTNVQLFCNDKYVGMDIGFSRKGWGWGHIILSCRLSDKTWLLDDDCTSKENVIEFLHAAIPDLVDQLYEKGNVQPEYNEDDYISLKFSVPKDKI